MKTLRGFILCTTVLAGFMECSKNPSKSSAPETIAPELSAPINEATQEQLTLTFDWSDIDDAKLYGLIVDNNADFRSPELQQDSLSQSSYVTKATLPDSLYFWRVRCMNEQGNWGKWSATWRFHIRTMISVQGGSFQMGDTKGAGNSDEFPVHAVTVSSFNMSRYEVTQAYWQIIMGTNPSHFKGDDTKPVEQATWLEAVEFCNALSQRQKLTPCYTIGNRVTCDFNANGYRLPTEAEWEYAARGGHQDVDSLYSGTGPIGTLAWYNENSTHQTHPVGQKEANELGFYDMGGNVWEWCWDWYGYYGSSPQTNPTGPESGLYRVLRGGSWFYSSKNCRCASRFRNVPDVGLNHVGFRPVRKY